MPRCAVKGDAGASGTGRHAADVATRDSEVGRSHGDARRAPRRERRSRDCSCEAATPGTADQENRLRVCQRLADLPNTESF